MALSEQEKRYYLDILGLGPDATYSAVKRTYNRLMKMYSSETSVLTPITIEFSKRKKEAVVNELKVAYANITTQIEHEQSQKNQKKKKNPVKTKESMEKTQDNLYSSLRMLKDIHKKLDIEERKLWKKFIFDFGCLMKDGTSLISSMKDFAEQLQDLEERMKSKKLDHQDIKKKLKSLKSKVKEIQKAYSYSIEGVIGFRRTLKVASKGKTLPEQISNLRESISSYQGAPTQKQIDKFASIKARIGTLLNNASEIKEKDIPELNDLLKKINFPFIKIFR